MPTQKHVGIERRVILAAFAWWKKKRPKGYSLGQHLSEPMANCKTPEELSLAFSVGHLVASSQCVPVRTYQSFRDELVTFDVSETDFTVQQTWRRDGDKLFLIKEERLP